MAAQDNLPKPETEELSKAIDNQINRLLDQKIKLSNIKNDYANGRMLTLVITRIMQIDKSIQKLQADAKKIKHTDTLFNNNGTPPFIPYGKYRGDSVVMHQLRIEANFLSVLKANGINKKGHNSINMQLLVDNLIDQYGYEPNNLKTWVEEYGELPVTLVL